MLNKLTRILFYHALTDLALQTNFIGTWKNPLLDSPEREHAWFVVLLGHAMINGWGILICTSYISLAILETIGHFIVDLGAMYHLYPTWMDQVWHVVYKIIIVYIWLAFEKDKLLKEETKRYWGKDRD